MRKNPAPPHRENQKSDNFQQSWFNMRQLFQNRIYIGPSRFRYFGRIRKQGGIRKCMASPPVAFVYGPSDHSFRRVLKSLFWNPKILKKKWRPRQGAKKGGVFLKKGRFLSLRSALGWGRCFSISIDFYLEKCLLLRNCMARALFKLYFFSLLKISRGA